MYADHRYLHLLTHSFPTRRSSDLDEAAVVYNVAFVIMSAVYLIPSVIYQKFLLPKIHIWANHDQETFVKAYEKGRLFMFLTGIEAILFVELLSPVIISILFGKKYAEAHDLLSILAIGIRSEEKTSELQS